MEDFKKSQIFRGIDQSRRHLTSDGVASGIELSLKLLYVDLLSTSRYRC